MGGFLLGLVAWAIVYCILGVLGLWLGAPAAFAVGLLWGVGGMAVIVLAG